MGNISLWQIYPLISLIVMLGLGLIVLKKNAKSVINRLFFMVSLVFAIWMFGTFMMFINSEDQKIIFWDRFIYLGVVFMPAFQYHFSLAFTYTNKKRKALLIIAYVLSVIFLVLSRTDYFVADIYKYRWGVHTIAQTFHHFFLAFFFFYIFALLYNFFVQYKNSIDLSEKRRIIYLIISFAILNLIGGLGYLPAYKVAIYSPVSLLAPLVFSIIVGYTIVVHRLMDIKMVMKRYLVHFLSFVAIILIVVIIKYLITRFLS
ncbi:MAG: histidine kinase N-terminal 7TM domain-containing protein [Patescibacteria group bacterium]